MICFYKMSDHLQYFTWNATYSSDFTQTWINYCIGMMSGKRIGKKHAKELPKRNLEEEVFILCKKI